jgi:hypothetical protein
MLWKNPEYDHGRAVEKAYVAECTRYSYMGIYPGAGQHAYFHQISPHLLALFRNIMETDALPSIRQDQKIRVGCNCHSPPWPEYLRMFRWGPYLIRE